MIYAYELQQLVSEWQKRLGDYTQPLSYKDALGECIYELNTLINNSINEEFDYQDYLDMRADEYLSSPENYERAV